MYAVSGNDVLDPAVVFPDHESAIFIDIDGLALEGIFKSADPDPLVDRAGKAFPFPYDGVIFLAFDQEVTALKFFKNPGKERGPVDIMTDFCAYRRNAALDSRYEPLLAIYSRQRQFPGGNNESCPPRQTTQGAVRQLFCLRYKYHSAI